MCERGVLHCDLSPTNFVLDPDRFTDDGCHCGCLIDFDYVAFMENNQASCDMHGTVSLKGGDLLYELLVTEIPLVDEDTERELFSLLGDWYEPKSIESLFSSLPSDAVFFSS